MHECFSFGFHFAQIFGGTFSLARIFVFGFSLPQPPLNLSDRTQSVVVNGSTSNPQSFLLFIIYINDVTSVVKHCKIQLYADDTLLYVSSSSITDIESMSSEDLKHIIEWLNNYFLYL